MQQRHLAGIDVPTLVLSGAETAPYYAVAAERVADCLPNALHVAWEGVNHDGPYRRPDDLARTALDFGAMID